MKTHRVRRLIWTVIALLVLAAVADAYKDAINAFIVRNVATIMVVLAVMFWGWCQDVDKRLEQIEIRLDEIEAKF